MRLWLNERRAVQLTIEEWEWIAETGGPKHKWPGFQRYKKEVAANCFLCELVSRRSSACEACPFYKHFGYDCLDTKSACYDYHSSGRYLGTGVDRKRAARAFLVQLREVLAALEVKNVKTC